MTRISYANSKDPDQSVQMCGLDSEKISEVCCLLLALYYARMYAYVKHTYMKTQAFMHVSIHQTMHAHAYIRPCVLSYLPLYEHKCIRAYGCVCA